MLCWNVVPTHPGTERSNRRPTAAEIAAGCRSSSELAARPPHRSPVGRLAHAALGGDVRPAPEPRRRGGVPRRAARSLLRVNPSAATPCCSRPGSSACPGCPARGRARRRSRSSLVTGIEGILGLGPAIFLIAGALAVAPGRAALDRFGRMPVHRAAASSLGDRSAPHVTALGCAIDSGVARLPRVRALRRGAGDRAAVARGRGRHVPAGAARARDVDRPLRRRLRRDLGAARLRPDVRGQGARRAHDLVVPWLAAGLFMLAGLAISFAASGPTRRSSSQALARRPQRRRAGGAAARDRSRRPGVAHGDASAPSRASPSWSRVMNLAGYVAVGHGHHAGRRLHRHQRAHRRHVRPRARRRRPRRPDRPPARDRDRPARDGRVEPRRSSGSTASPAMASRSSGSGSAGTSPTSPRPRELVDLAAPSERGRLIGFTDLLSSFAGAALALGGGVVYTRRRLDGARASPRRVLAVAARALDRRAAAPLAPARGLRASATLPRRRTPCPPLLL